MAQTTIFSTGSSWKYNDSGTDLGTSWSGSTYNDASWSSGNAILGYGTINAGTINTTLSYGGNSSNKYPTYYFRKTFNGKSYHIRLSSNKKEAIKIRDDFLYELRHDGKLVSDCIFQSIPAMDST